MAFWSGYSQPGGSLRVREVQRALRALDYRPGPVDGLFGPLTERAVIRFQRAEALEPDGIVGPHTLRRLRIRVDRDRPTTSSPKSRSRSPDRPTVAPGANTRPAPAPTPTPAEPADPGPDRGVLVLVALLGLLGTFLGLLLFAGALLARQSGSLAWMASRAREPEDRFARSVRRDRPGEHSGRWSLIARARGGWSG